MGRVCFFWVVLTLSARLAADGTPDFVILDGASETLPKNLKLCKSSDKDKCVMAADKERACVRLEQHGGASGGYWVISVPEKINIRDYRYLKVEARSEPDAEMTVAFMTTTGKGSESFSTSFSLGPEWKTILIPVTQNEYGRGGFKFGRSFGASDNDVLRAGRLTAVWLTAWKHYKQVFYVRDLRLTNNEEEK